MWGFGGRYYWGSKERRRGEDKAMKGIVVLFAWMSSEEKHLKHYADLYASLGWDSLICHSQFLNSFFPEKAKLLALDVLNELIEAVKIRPRPVVFVAFSGGPKACLYKVLQIIEGKFESQTNVDDYRLVKDCVAGHIYDSSPVDFVSKIGTRFVVHPSILKASRPPKLAKWIANGIASGLDTFFLDKFEVQRADYWQTLYSSVNLRAPYLILCSEDDDIAPFQTICNFSQRLKELGGDVTLVKWDSSPHVGHYRKYPDEYKTAVARLLQKASTMYSYRIQQMVGDNIASDGSHNSNSEPFRQLQQVGVIPNEEIRRASDHFLVPSSSLCHEGRGMSSISIQDEFKESLIQLPRSPPSVNAHGVLGEILFDRCVPKDVEDWELKHPIPRRPSNFNPIKFITRSSIFIG
ncbi:hypothetical protein V2J09_007159 [Rumex salicifolius]